MFKKLLLFLLLLFPLSAEAYYLPNVEFRAFLPGTNLPVVNGFVYFYLAGTLQLQTVYSDSLCSVPLPNPVSLNTNGQPTTASGSVTAICANSALDIQIFDSGMNLIDSSMKSVSFQPLQTILSSEWIPVTGIPVYVSATQFTITGNHTDLFTVGRRVQIVITGGTIYGSVVSSSYGSGSTTITVTFDSGSMNSGLSAVSVGLLNAMNESMPSVINEPLISFSPSTQVNFSGKQIMSANTTISALNYAVDFGTTNAMSVTLIPAPAAYADGMVIFAKSANTNTSTAVTLQVNGLGAITVSGMDGIGPQIGGITSGESYAFIYSASASKFFLINPTRIIPTAPVSYLSGSGTYTTPFGTKSLRIQVWGGGGGGNGSSLTAGNGAASSFGASIVVAGGGGGATGAIPGGGGTASAGSFQANGLPGITGINMPGGVSIFGGQGGYAGATAGYNYPGGGGWAGTGLNGAGGGGGAYAEGNILNPASSYSYTVGAGGSGNGSGAGSGGVGLIIVTAYF